MDQFRRAPLAALRAFAAAARRRSFKDAAEDLGVSPSAISHQVRLLERWLGTPLFERQTRLVTLTPAGQRLAQSAIAAFDDLERAVAAAAHETAPPVVRVSALPLFTNAWLVPRLSRFEARAPHASIAIQTENRLADILGEEADVGIRNVTTPSPGLLSRKLLDLRATPLCVPRLAAKLRTPSDLAHATLIEISAGRAGWAQWLAAMQLEDLRPKRWLSFDTIPSAIEAAAQGRGVLLGLTPLIWDATAAADLVAPLAAPAQEAGCYFVVYRRRDASHALIRSFVDWICDEMKRDLPRLRALDAKRQHSPDR